MSVQLQALADEVFNAAAAHARAGGHAIRRPFGEVISNPAYPDLAFVNVIQDLAAPDWTIQDLERAINRELSGARRVRVNSRDPRTIASLGPRLAAAGYTGEVRVGMLQVTLPNAQLATNLSIEKVESRSTWGGVRCAESRG